MNHLSLTALILIVLTSCSDNNDLSISSDNLTECPAETNCSNLFTESADFDQAFHLKSGNFRVFMAEQKKTHSQDEIRSMLYIKAPMEGKSF